MAYTPMLPDLPSGDAHGGWLASSSPSILNLWEVNAGVSEEPLMASPSPLHHQSSALLSQLLTDRLYLWKHYYPTEDPSHSKIPSAVGRSSALQSVTITALLAAEACDTR